MNLFEIEELEGLAAPLTGEQWAAIGVPGLRARGIRPDVWSGPLLHMSLATASLGGLCALWGVGLGLVLRHQVRLDETTEVVGRDLLQGPAITHGRVVDEAIETAVARHDLVDGRRRGFEIGDVERHREGVRNVLGDLAGALGVAPIDPDHGAGRRHAPRDLEPQPARRAGDQSDAAGQRETFESRTIWRSCH